MNLLVISGHLGGDAEIKYTPSGKALCAFSMAVNSGWGDNKKTIWVKCNLWGDRAEKLAPYLKKGSRPTVTGEMGVDTWKTQGGEDKFTVTCNVRDVDLPPKDSNTPTHLDAQAKHAAEADVFDNDIPF